jgi:hypothetical protein
VRVEITVVSVVITFVRVKIAMRVENTLYVYTLRMEIADIFFAFLGGVITPH